MKLSILAAPVPGAGLPSAARGPLEGNAPPDFEALLGGLAKDAPAGTPPALVPGALPPAQAAAPADASVTGALVPGNGEEPGFGSQKRTFSPVEGETQLSDASDAAAQPLAGAAKAPGVTSLLRLAARAAAPGESGVVAATIASDVAAAAAPAPGAKVAGSAVPAAGGAQASDHDGRKALKPDTDTPAGAVPDAMMPVPTTIAALFVATAALAPAAGPDVKQPLARSEAPMPAGAAAPKAGIVPVPASAGATLPTVDDAWNSSPTLPTTAAPAAAAGDFESSPVAPAATSVDAAIAPGSVRVESHLGFDRSARIGATAALGRDTTGGAESASAEPSRSKGSRSADLRSPAALDPISAGADVEVVDAGSPRPPKTGDAASSNGGAPSVAPSAAMHAPDAAAAMPTRPTRAPDTASSAGTGRLSGPSSTSSVPEAVDAAASDAAGVTPARPTRAPDIASSAGTGRLAVPPSATLAPEAEDAADSDAAPTRAPVLASSVGAGRLAVPPSTSSAPEAEDAPANDVADVVPARSTRAPDMIASAGTGRLAVPPSTTLAPEARRSAAAATSFVGSPPVAAEASLPDEVALSVSSKTEPAMDEPNTPAAGTTGQVTTAPVAALAVPNAQAAPPVAQQVAEGVRGLAATAVPDEAGSGTKVAPARTMALQLSPAGLGTLTVRLHVTGRALDVHLEASDGRTAALIDRDRDALTGALRGKDYQLQTLSVTTHDATMPGGPHAERGTESRFADAGSTDPGPSGRSRDEPSGGRPGGGSAREAPERAARPPHRSADEASLERGGSSLFV